MESANQSEQGDTRDETAGSSTLRTSQTDQARGYLESLTNTDLMGEIQSALTHAQRLTKQPWKIVVTADDVEISCGEADGETNKRIKIPKPKTLRN